MIVYQDNVDEYLYSIVKAYLEFDFVDSGN